MIFDSLVACIAKLKFQVSNCMAFPGMKLPLLIPDLPPRNGSIDDPDQNSTEEDEEEIDDDEEGTLQEVQDSNTKTAA